MLCLFCNARITPKNLLIVFHDDIRPNSVHTDAWRMVRTVQNVALVAIHLTQRILLPVLFGVLHTWPMLQNVHMNLVVANYY